MGDPAGIGPEIVAKAWLQARGAALKPFAYLGAPETISNVPVKPITHLREAASLFYEALPVLPITLAVPAIPGQPASANAPAILKSLEEAAALCLSGDASAMVTAPVAKEQLYGAGFNAPGQTEFLADLCGTQREETVMMLAGPSLRVVPLTIHIPLKDVPQRLTKALILSRAKTTAAALQRDFSISKPRLALCGLNPHSGENGAIGREEIDVIIPAIEQLRADGIDARGPFSADTLFHEEARSSYDAVLSMYHDQGLIAIKTLHFYDGVNTTLGLPIVRTSPDHGTAFDIAGSGKADARSMIAALELAGDIAAKRQKSAANA
jgi:4-hydroxythreonine-4-phosphate dehydrogenase